LSYDKCQVKRFTVPVVSKPLIFMKFSRKGPVIREKYGYGSNLSFVVHPYICLVLKNHGTLIKYFLKWIE